MLRRALVGYVRAVADAIGVSVEGTSCEVADTVTAYVALSRRSPRHPGRDLMLLWNSRQGWTLAVETAPAEPPLVVSRLGGDVVPEPALVARFVADVLSASHSGAWTTSTSRTAADRGALAARLERRARPVVRRS
ncbi:DUF6292 family protein [Amycolatopsis rhabdoformis]|uniref:DUF6292 family protein n=1 Tax=Amycolatopsis rhabdoformis TaxID=1448059 RepID=A0ABZ1HUV3_9PSEU|nr:DUF6292 family protein [Amycolatopsis rhabdoformis]WSE25910.1 DUF6292 family protein [Amycolatopsis rhabdoformis]